ncbi:2-dehydropantoate 2-reductase N-terminal domain-containing protein [Salinicoccus bachuensis]|uniref:6-phosphogluconate dehydrogenase, decarboxylating n=1 Tax=Salinicoccus bachuensis TaxID=3136731 RepID=A0ABZ3CKZ7_9STAP
MKIAVIGIGAVGSVIAREMKMLPHDITLFGRSRKEGFTIQEDGERRHYPYTIEDISAYEGDAFDIIFIATKATALKSISGIIPAMAHRDTEVILCENGMGFDEYFDAPVPAVVYISGQKHEDRIEHFQDARLLIADRTYAYIDRLITDLEDTTGVELEIGKTDEFRRIRYEKLLINLGINSLTALSGNTAKIYDLEAVTALTRGLLEEGLSIINQDEEIIDRAFVDKALSVYQDYNREMGTSMYYDVMSGVPTEYTFIQKYLQQQKGQIRTPILDIVVTLLEAYQYER